MSSCEKPLYQLIYKAGPANVQKIRQRTVKMGLNPNVWFQNAEVAAAKIIGRETVQYVSNIYKYYIAYRMTIDRMLEKQEVMKSLPEK